MSVVKQKIIVGMSGGVDSAVAALKLVRAGHDVAGLHMTNWEDDDGYCTAAADLQDARTICRELDIPLHSVNFAAEYRDQVFSYFLDEYKRGRTPNPDVLCNREIKFGVFLEYARRLGAEKIATGHYARVNPGPPAQLLKAADAGKDQTYFLHQVSELALRDTLFPLGDTVKSDVRRIANEAGLPVYDKRDSTGICFIGERPFKDFLSQFLTSESGVMQTPEGIEIGQHAGVMYYTLGQRQGLGIGGVASGNDEPWFVAEKDPQRNILTVVQGRDHPLLWSDEMTTESPHWINGAPNALTTGKVWHCTVKTRYRQQDVPARVMSTAQGLHVAFDTPQWAVTPGQYAVFYDGDVCSGGAVIESAIHVATAVADTGTAPL